MSSEIAFIQPVHTLWFCFNGETKEEANIPPEACRVPFAGSELYRSGIVLYVGFEEVQDVPDTTDTDTPAVIYPITVRRD